MASITYVVASRGRPQLEDTISSILGQEGISVELIVVFDGVEPTVRENPSGGARFIALPSQVGVSKARNLGARAARSDFLSFIDDDDWVSSRHATTSISSLEESQSSSVVVSGVSGYIDRSAEPVYKRLPPSFSPKGSHWNLSNKMSWAESLTKQSAVLERQFFWSIGGFDESLAGRQWTELFWRANAASSVVGLQQPLYFRQVWGREHRRRHIGGSAGNRWRNFQQLVSVQSEMIRTHQTGFRRMLSHHRKSLKASGHPELARLVSLRNAPLLTSSTRQCPACSHDS